MDCSIVSKTRSLNQSTPTTAFAVTNIPTSGPVPFRSQALTYAGDGQFILSEFGQLYSITTTGEARYLTNLNDYRTVQGLALVGRDLDRRLCVYVGGGQSATLSVSGGDLALQDNVGNTLAVGSADGNRNQVINNFVAPSSGTYFATIRGTHRCRLQPGGNS